MPNPNPNDANRALIVVSSAVLLSSGTWFTGTAAAPDLMRAWSLQPTQAVWLTISVQLGFIAGTFLYSILNLADVFNTRRVFFVSAVLGAVFNAAFGFLSGGLWEAVLFRFLTGVTLAGVYPVGMKLVASWFRTGLGWRLGIMVGAIALGTAFPYLFQLFKAQVPWQILVGAASVTGLAGGVLVLCLLSDGPYLQAKARFDPAMITKVFRHAPFRNTAFGYFGHMWELYTFWSLLPFFLGSWFQDHTQAGDNWIPLIAFLVVGIGSLGCAGGGWVSRKAGEKRVAIVSLWISATMCLGSGIVYELSFWLVVPLVCLWGIFVVSDSPQFSALAARYCPAEYTGTALTVQNGIGFAITTVSLQITPWIARSLGWRWSFTYLALGPLVGIYFMRKLPARNEEPGMDL